MRFQNRPAQSRKTNWSTTNGKEQEAIAIGNRKETTTANQCNIDLNRALGLVALVVQTPENTQKHIRNDETILEFCDLEKL